MPFDFPNAPNAGDVYTGYIFDGVTWNITGTSVAASIGDVKSAVTLTDHSGWVRMDGRLVSTLTTSQQAAAATLGWTTNLPDAVNKVLMQTTGTIGSAGGSNVLTQANLPNITLNTAIDGHHQHSVSLRDNAITNSPGDKNIYSLVVNGGSTYWSSRMLCAVDGAISYTDTGNFMNAGGEHDHTVALGGSGTAINPAHIVVNQFVYLGT